MKAESKSRPSTLIKVVLGAKRATPQVQRTAWMGSSATFAGGMPATAATQGQHLQRALQLQGPSCLWHICVSARACSNVWSIPRWVACEAGHILAVQGDQP